ncbi:MAG: aminotransferase class I/II-fold pyridoxal phosphate-dependent enzyme [Archangium sp.]|nr:aminotransferase class I/II-fold pyridoxal phosphate-dependent enzyme [Archangium sp.]
MSPSKSEHREAIAVVGMACRFPHAKDLPALWRVISTGEVTFEDIDDTRWKHSAFYEPTDVRAVDKTYVRKGAFIDGVDEFAALHYGLAPRRVQVMDPQHRLCIEATRQALQDAGYDSRPYDKSRTGVFIGASVSEYKDLMTARHRAQQAINGEFGDTLGSFEAEAIKGAVADVVPGRAFTIAGSLLNMIACSVAQTFDFNGPALSIDAACSSALVAIHEATVNLRARQINVAVAGGVYLNLNPDNLIGFSRIGAISPSGACRPFDAKADGFVMGEGVGLVVLKRLDDAIRDGDRVYAVLRGSGCNNDGRGEGPMTPRPEGQRDAMWRAHADCDFPVDTISYVETHGTATTVGDVVEVGALKHFFNERAGKTFEEPFCNLGSIKGNIGHTMSAAGVAGFIKTCLMLHHGVIPPQPGVEEINPKLDLEHSPFHIAREAKKWDVPLRRAAVSSFGFGGTNAHVLLEEVVKDPLKEWVHSEQAHLFLVSAPNHALLRQHARELAAEITEHSLIPADVARTLVARQGFDCRVSFLASSREELLAKLVEVETGAIAPTTPVPAEQRQIAFLFAGQGAQKTGLLKDLVVRFPALRAKLEQYDRAVAAEHGFSLIDALYPGPGTDPVVAQKHLTQTHVCQPAMAALGIALGELLLDCGVTPTLALGHSLGEFAAASVAGMLSGVDAVKLVAKRGALMNELKLTDPGAMLAVMAERALVEKHLYSISGVVVANHNHPTQVVLSGTTKGIEAAQKAMDAAGLKSTRLDVSHAFHSPLMAGMDVKMGAALLPMALQEPGKHGRPNVSSCITGKTYASAAEAKEIWVRHATSPVNFVDALQTCADEGTTHFIQVGAGGALLSFARGVAPNAQVHALAPNEGGDGGAMLLTALGQLWVKGVPVNAAPLFAGTALVTLPPTPLEVQKYWAMERTARPPRPVTKAPIPQQQVMPMAQQFARPVQTHFIPQQKGPVAMDNLLALFQQQMQLMQSQAEMMKQQAAAIAALTGGGDASALMMAQAQAVPMQAQGGAAVAVQPAPVVIAKPPDFSNLVAKKEAPAPAAAKTNGNGSHALQTSAPVAAKEEPAKVSVRPQVQKMVLEAVARISAFPLQTLKLEQTLVGELGFDSLMLVELDQSVGKAYPAVGGLPRELFSKNTTSATIIDHLVGVLEKGVTEKKEAPTANLPLERYVPTVVAAPLAPLSETVLAFDRAVLVVKDGKGVAEALASKLKAEGVTVVVGDVNSPGEFGGVINFVNPGSPPNAVGPGGSVDYRTASRDALALAKKVGGEKAELFISVTTLGGQLGMSAPVARESLGQVGALGFTRALASEWNDALVKAIDVDAALGAEAIAQHILDEIASGDRCAEVGFDAKGRHAVSLQVASVSASIGEKGLDAKSVVVITGGAKGLGFKFARGLAKSGVTLALTGRTNQNEEIGKALAQLTTAGAKAATYHPMNVRDAASVKTAIDAIRKQHGRVDVVVHNAGLLADALIEKKDAAQLDSVLETKVGGALALLDATATDNLSALVLISSWAGRFGNAAQTDYSAANAMLSRLAAPSKTTRTLAIDFPPWEDSEMVKKIPAFKKAELKADGVTFLSDDEGVKAFLGEVKSGVGEVLVGRGLPERTLLHRSSFPVSRLNHIYLNDHTMAGQRVLPFAAAMDHLAAAAIEASGKVVLAGKFTPFALSDVKLQRAVLVPDTIWLETSVKQKSKSPTMNVTLTQGGAPSYTGTVTIGADTNVAPTPKAMAPSSLPMSLKDFYGGFTFHGPRLQGITQIDALSDDGVVGWVKGCRPSDWIKEPLRTEWSVDPLILDASFQLAGYWAWVKQQRAGFPVSLGRFVQLAPFGLGPLKVTVTFESSNEDTFSGTLVWQNEKGAVVAYATGMTAEFKKRDPQFNTAAKPVAAPVVEESAEPVAEVVAVSGEVEESSWNPAKFPEYEALKERMAMAEAFGLQNPYFSVHEAICGDTTVVGGKPMLNFSSYNYVGNSGDPVVSKAAQDAIAKYGTSVSASRVASGEKPLTLELEKALAEFFGTEDSIVLVSGHATNVTVIGHVCGAGDLIVHDALAHDSIIQGAKLSGAKRRPFPHNDWEALDRMLTNLRPHYRRVLIAIEGTYSMDGDIPELPKFIEVKKKHKAMLLVDEAHSAGVVGPTGRGIGEHFNVNRADVDMWMGTLSKSFASCGGYIAGSKALVEYLKYTTPGFVYSVGIPPPNAAAALAATRQMLKHPERSKKAKDNAAYFIKLLKERGLNSGMSKDTAVVPLIVGNSVLCLQLSDSLKKRGINVQPILYPAVEEDQARLRFFLSSLHSPEQLLLTANTAKEELERLTREMNGDAVA